MENNYITLLVVDDNNDNLKFIGNLLEMEGYDPVLANNGYQALSYIEQEKPHLILLDVMMPEIDGYEVCQALKSNTETKDIPVIFLTAKSEPDDLVKGFEIGAVDYITKPFNICELKARVKNHLDLFLTRQKLQQANEQLKQTLTQLEIAGITDQLTGLYNRRYFVDKIEYEIGRSKRNVTTFAIIIGDLDDFKQINDMYGHLAGDYVLIEVARMMQESVRSQDIISRWGGEEFIIILPDTDEEGALIVAEKIRTKIADFNFIYESRTLNVTVTFGVTRYGSGLSANDMIKKADNALYQGKRHGKNKTIIMD